MDGNSRGLRKHLWSLQYCSAAFFNASLSKRRRLIVVAAQTLLGNFQAGCLTGSYKGCIVGAYSKVIAEMPKVSIYVSDGNMSLYESAKSQLGDSVSSVFVRCLERELEANKIETNRIIVEIRDPRYDGVLRRRAFAGVWLIGSASASESYWYALGAPDDAEEARYSVARTKRNQIAVFAWDGAEIVSMAVWQNFDDFASPKHDYPENFIQAVASKLGVERIEELDI